MEIEQKWFDLANQELKKLHLQTSLITQGMLYDALVSLKNQMTTLDIADFAANASASIRDTEGLLSIMYPESSAKRIDFITEELKTFFTKLEQNNGAGFVEINEHRFTGDYLKIRRFAEILELKKTAAMHINGNKWDQTTAFIFLSGFSSLSVEEIGNMFKRGLPDFFSVQHFLNLQRGTSSVGFLQWLLSKLSTLTEQIKERDTLGGLSKTDNAPSIDDVLHTRAQQQRNLERENEFVESKSKLMEPSLIVLNKTLAGITVPEDTKVEPASSPLLTVEKIVHAIFTDFELNKQGFNWHCVVVKDEIRVHVYCEGRLIKVLTFSLLAIKQLLTHYEWSGVVSKDVDAVIHVAWRKPGYHLELSELKKWLATSPFHIPKLKVRLSDSPLLPTTEVVSTLSNELIGYLKTLLNNWPALGLSLSIIENDGTVVKNINFRHIRDRLFVDGIEKVEKKGGVWSLALVDSFGVVLTTLNIKELLRAIRLRYVIRNNCTHGSLVYYTRDDIVKDSVPVAKHRTLFNVTEFLNNLIDSFEAEGRTPFVLPLKVYTLIYEDFAQWLENQLSDAYHTDIANNDNSIEVRVDSTLSGVTYCVSLNNVMVTQGTVTKTYFDKALEKGLEWGSHAPKFFVIPTERTYEVIS